MVTAASLPKAAGSQSAAQSPVAAVVGVFDRPFLAFPKHHQAMAETGVIERAFRACPGGHTNATDWAGFSMVLVRRLRSRAAMRINKRLSASGRLKASCGSVRES